MQKLKISKEQLYEIQGAKGVPSYHLVSIYSTIRAGIEDGQNSDEILAQIVAHAEAYLLPVRPLAEVQADVAHRAAKVRR